VEGWKGGRDRGAATDLFERSKGTTGRSRMNTALHDSGSVEWEAHGTPSDAPSARNWRFHKRFPGSTGGLFLVTPPALANEMRTQTERRCQCRKPFPSYLCASVCSVGKETIAKVGNDRQGSATIGNDRQKSEVSATIGTSPWILWVILVFPCRSSCILGDRWRSFLFADRLLEKGNFQDLFDPVYGQEASFRFDL
jgi:hypothetical protein